jgi:hypothetical protein
MIPLLVSFIIFCVVVAIVFMGWKWLCAQAGIGDPIARGGLLVLGAIAIIYNLVEFISPLDGEHGALHR